MYSYQTSQLVAERRRELQAEQRRGGPGGPPRRCRGQFPLNGLTSGFVLE